MERGVEIVDQWFEQPNVHFLAPGELHWGILRQLMIEGQARGPLLYKGKESQKVIRVLKGKTGDGA
ncbi:MAG: hypothetical protein ABI833_09685 [Acidobacteriota bacterium]